MKPQICSMVKSDCLSFEKKQKLYIALSSQIGSSIANELAFDLFFKQKFNPFSQSPSCLDEDLLIASFVYLSQTLDWFKQSFDWSCLCKFLKSSNSDLKWLAMQCLRFVCNMSEETFLTWSQSVFESQVLDEIRVKYKNLFKQDVFTSFKDHNLNPFIKPYLIDMYGVSLIKYQPKQDGDNFFIITSSIEANLKLIATSVTKDRPTLIEGVLGSGKTSLIEYIASQTGRYEAPYLTKIQIGNQVDGKLLIGTYCCTDIPGEFIWKPGPLTQALLNGHWLLIEDIDYASADVLTLLLSIIKSKSLKSIPGFNFLNTTIDPRFRIFFTRRVNHGYTEFFNSIDKELLYKLCDQIIVTPVNDDEMRQIIVTRWPKLNLIIDRILKMYNLLKEDNSLNLNSKAIFFNVSNRSISFRDILKWCKRVSTYFELVLDNTQQEYLLLDASDCFIQNLPYVKDRITKVELIGAQFNIADKFSQQICFERQPMIQEIDNKMISIGRVCLQKQANDKLNFINKFEVIFSRTQQSMLFLEKLACCVKYQEPVLLVGETGTGKTSLVQYLCHLLNQKLIVVNMNQQSDTCDLLGGYKPIEVKFLIEPIRKEFEQLFELSFNLQQNEKFLRNVWLLFKNQSWDKYFTIISYIQQQALLCRSRTLKAVSKIDQKEILERWKNLGTKVSQLRTKIKDIRLAFSYIEGTLVKCMKNGDWILLDEINLAEYETLQCLSSILDNENELIWLLDKADGKPIFKHSNFRLFACMNPSTDVGKKDLPLGIRNRFSEFFFEELENESDLRILVSTYLNGIVSTSQVNKIVQFYLKIRKEANQTLKDGNGLIPHFSLRTLCRALRIASSPLSNESRGIQRTLFESFCLSFLTQLDTTSSQLVESMIVKDIIGVKNVEIIRKISISKPSFGEYEKIDDYWISKGSKETFIDENYILTPSIARNLRDLARIVSIGPSYPVLIQGETSIGKTSLIKYLAQRSGNVCLRVNNHEHTDLQEYVGCYTADVDGKLFFKEGVLVEAMRKGYWIILDELNLASTEVLESLNRVLDDNRELFIPETQELIQAHPKFLLFATQNPPGHYGGRKVLSRAFKNRFIELHFNEIPSKELETILHKKCSIPLSYSKKMVSVLMELRNRLHQSVSLSFTGKHGGVTLRDLFRWGERYRLFCEKFSSSERFYDWDFHLAREGYLLLAGRSRSSVEEEVIRSILVKTFNIKSINPLTVFDDLFDQYFLNTPLSSSFSHLFWTHSLKRLAVLLFQALNYNEPTLLIGSTGCGKTTICQLFASVSKKKLFTVNCHMHTESSDFIGGIRPIRNHDSSDSCEKLFEWTDGPLIQAMQTGSVFLIDEISLADDSVLERINSVLEPERIILMSEKSAIDTLGADHSNLILKAKDGFHLVATMNPGDDYGKKELSPALKNRFTEIWCFSSSNLEDIEKIIDHNIIYFESDIKTKITSVIINYLFWHFNQLYQNDFPTTSIRDVLSITNFINITTKPHRLFKLNPAETIWHSVNLVMIDSIKFLSNPSLNCQNIQSKCKSHLKTLIEDKFGPVNDSFYSNQLKIVDNMVTLDHFFIEKGKIETNFMKNDFIFDSPLVLSNVQRLFRALQLPKPVLIEGIPGIGKTSLIQALAKFSGYNLIRINLSEQTDISDLFGADLPIEGKEGQFCWRDGPFLQALKSNYTWILLDELNLASQTVLEGLNACLDHRGEVFIPELGKSFKIEKKNVRIFGCQNPHSQGDDRKGLPKSFLNRFTMLFFESLTFQDLKFIIQSSYNQLDDDLIDKMVCFNQLINQELLKDLNFGSKGLLSEFNLRDILRWSQIIDFEKKTDLKTVAKFANLIYSQRFRTNQDRAKVNQIFENIFKIGLSQNNHQPFVNIFPDSIQIENSKLSRKNSNSSSTNWLLLNSQMSIIESVMKCIEMNWMCLLIGYSGFGKTSLIHFLAHLTGNNLKQIIVNSEMDTIELLGGFKQFDFFQNLNLIEAKIEIEVRNCIKQCTLNDNFRLLEWILHKWFDYCNFSLTGSADLQLLISKLTLLEKIVNKIENETKLVKEKKELNYLKKFVIGKHSINSSGSFQWFNSVLINALQDGDWLLIDEVNLCPSSVIDRLNSLLEPNGSLFINEKGIINGQIPTIKPHPNFRLILSMDPKNGELSKAMRNRGIEIFCLSQFNEIDFKVRMHQVGLFDLNIQKLLISAHLEYLNNASIIPDEDFNGNYLIQAASKILIQLNNGISLDKAIENTIKSKLLPSTLLPFFSSLNLNSTQQISVDPILNHYYFRRSTRAITADSLMHNVLVDWSLFETFFSNFSSKFKQSQNNFHLFLSTSLIIFFERSSKSDISLRQKLYFNQNSSMISITPSQLNKTLTHLHIPLNLNLTSPYLPIDVRFNTFVWKDLCQRLQSDQIEAIELNLNQFLIHLFNLKLNSIENFVNQRSTSSLLKLSQDFEAGHLNISELSFDALKFINSTINFLESKFNLILNKTISPSDFENFKKLLLWFHGFKIFLKSDCKIEEEKEQLWDCLIVFWNVFSEKLTKFNSHHFKLNHQMLNQLTKSLRLKSNQFYNFQDFKNDYNFLAICKCSKTEKTYLKSIQLIKLLNSFGQNLDKAFNIEKWSKMLAEFFKKLSNNVDDDWPVLSKLIDELEFEIKKSLNDPNLSCDDNERNDYDWKLKFFNRNFLVERQLLPLNQLMFNFFEVTFLNENQDLINLQNLAKRLYIHPLHHLLLEKIQVNSNYLNDLVFYHYLDIEKVSSTQDIYNMLNLDYLESQAQFSANRNESENEWMKSHYAVECSPNLTYISTKMLSSKSTLGSMVIKNNQITNLLDYLTLHQSVLVDFKKFDLLKPYLSLILKLFVKMKKSINNFIEKLSLNFDINCDQMSELFLLKCVDQQPYQIGYFFSIIGLYNSFLYAPLKPIDPIQKWHLKLEQYKLESDYLDIELDARNMLSLIKSGSQLNPSNEHPLVTHLMTQKNLVDKKIEKLKSRQEYRPVPSQYQKLKSDVLHFLETVLNIQKFQTFCEKLLMANNSTITENLEEKSGFIIESNNIQKSIHNFIAHIYYTYQLYGNIINGFLTSLCIILQGLRIQTHTLQQQIVMAKDLSLNSQYEKMALTDFIKSLNLFPNPDPIHRSLLSTKFTLQKSLIKILSKTKSGLMKNVNSLYKSALLDLKIGITLNRFNDKAFQNLFIIIDCFLASWLKNEAERKQKKLEEESIFHYKTQIHENEITEDVQEKIEIAQKFPSFNHEFQDLIPELLTSCESTTPTFEDSSLIIDNQDIIEICNIHESIMNIILTQNASHQLEFNHSQKIRFQIFSNIFDYFGPLIERKIDNDSIENHILLCKSQLNDFNFSIIDANFNFYKDPCPQELTNCYKILETIKQRIFQDLLPQFPGHPVLRQLLVIIDRMYNFESDSPLAKFTTGLEVLLKAAQDWEQNAHSKIKLSQELENVFQLIIKWRKLELACWTRCLEDVKLRIKTNETIKFWFHFYSLIHTTLKSEQRMTLESRKQFLTLLFQFMNESNIGQFHSRLHLICNFINHIKCVDLNQKFLSFQILLSNIYHFYQQFETEVDVKIISEKKPIEKELKEFVKIMKWTSGNFWDIKSKIEKSHKTLHRLTKKFETSLNFPIQSLLKIPEYDLKSNFKKFKLPFISAFEKENQIKIFNEGRTFKILSRLNFLLTKTERYCRKTKKHFKPLQNSINDLNKKIGVMIETIEEMQTLTVPLDIKEKERYEKEIRSINNIKRQSFTLLLKMLSEFGVSYKKGLDSFNKMTVDKIFLSCLTLDQMPMTSLNISEDILSCNNYFYKSLFRYTQLTQILTNPSDELKTFSNAIDQIRGISGHLMNNVVQSRNSLAHHFKNVNQLENLLKNFKKLNPNQPCQLLSLPFYNKWVKRLAERLSSLVILLHQLKDLTSYAQRTNLINLNHYQTYNISIETIDELLKKLNSISKKIVLDEDSIFISFVSLQELQKDWKSLEEIALIFSGKELIIKDFEHKATVLCYLNKLAFQIREDLVVLNCEYNQYQIKKTFDVDQDINNLYEKSEHLICSLLLVIQNMFKFCFSIENTGQEKRLKNVIPKISEDILSQMNIKKIIYWTTQVFKMCLNITHANNQQATLDMISNSLFNLKLFLEQYLSLFYFLITFQINSLRINNKLLYIILNLFTSVTEKGFCLPPQFQDNSLIKDDFKLKDLTNAGLGEGQGENDVSEMIENEDQLDETFEAKQEKKQEQEENENDIKNEKNGIEMSEDFDAQAFSPEMKNDKEKEEDDSESENEEDLDKKMGDVNKNDDVLDEKMWNDEEDEDSEMSDNLDDDENNVGGEDFENRLIAKNENKDLEKKSENKNENENEENNEENNEKNNEKINELENEIMNDDYEDEKRDSYKNQNLSNDVDSDEDKDEFIENMELDKEDESDEDIDADNEKEDIDDKYSEYGDKDLNDVEVGENENENQGEDEDGDEDKRESEDKDEDEIGLNEEISKNQEESFEEIEKNENKKDKEKEAIDTQTIKENAIDSEINSILNDNVQLDPKYNKEEKVENEIINDNLSKDENGGGSCQAELKNDSHEGKVDSSTVHEKAEKESEPNFKFELKKRGNRSLSQNKDKKAKRLKMVEKFDSVQNQEETKNDLQKEFHLYQHCDEKEFSENQAIDLADEESAQRNKADQEGEKISEEDEIDEFAELEEKHSDVKKVESCEERQPKLNERESKSKKKDLNKATVNSSEDIEMEDGPDVLTSTVSRAPISEMYTKLDLNSSKIIENEDHDSWFDRLYEKISKSTCQEKDLVQKKDAWAECEKVVTPLVYQICAQLQLVLEPMKAAKLKGDYRSGKRLNMRKVIEYIASQYRKDKIWLRRTKPSKRQYQIILAIDDSLSMTDNRSKKMAFESIALLGKSLTIIEAGELAIMSFGEKVELLHSFGEPFTCATGSKLLSKLSFDQGHTRIAELLEKAASLMFQSQLKKSKTDCVISQLLLIISDGRGLFNEGEVIVLRAIRKVQDLGIFIVFVVLDNSDNQDSILDIKVPIFDSNGSITIESYMDKFPFPFYIILRDINNLPKTLGEALRKWFELVLSTDRVK